MIVVTGATGQLGREVVGQLLAKVPPSEIVAAVRSPEKAQELAALGVEVRHADYAQPATLDAAFAGADRLLLVSSSENGHRLPQHEAVIDAARKARVNLLAYTSILHADTSTLLLADEHKATEAYLKASGVPFVFLRNGWYTENRLAAIGPAIEHGTILGAAGDGRFATASRADYAGAAVAVLTSSGHENQIYELGGDSSYTLTELAAEVSRQVQKPVVYRNLPEAEYENILVGLGLPVDLARLIADADAQAAHGELDDTSRALSRLLGRPTTPLAESIRLASAAFVH